MKKTIGQYLYACGDNQIPTEIKVDGHRHVLDEILKHDFFAATALYITKPSQNGYRSKVILKLGRQQHFFGIPLLWLGQMLRDHELSILRILSSLEQVPHPLTEYGSNGFVYEYIEGHTLQEKQTLPDNFFDNLSELLKKIHQKSVAYLDMNKRSNIIIGSDGRPYLIDFQISIYFEPRPWLLKSFNYWLRQVFQDADLYHLFKHKRKLSPHQLKPEEQLISRPNPL
ncbi:MAG: protein kinase family protein, partial [Planctomycetota bacterium]